MFTGYEPKAGDHLVGLKENGFRSNGLSLVRKVLSDNYGQEWHLDHKDLAEKALQPSKIYCAAITDMIGSLDEEPQAEIHGFAHITGGGIPGKLGRVLKPTGLGADIKTPFEPSEIMLHCQELGNISNKEAYKTWNMGNGGIVITPEPDSVIDIAKKHDIEAAIIGVVTQEKGISIDDISF